MEHSLSKSTQIRIAANFEELVNIKFKDAINSVCWSRTLNGDFEEIVAKLELKEDITVVSRQELKALGLSDQGNVARETILQDLQLLEDHGALPTLNLLKCYQRDDELDFISTDVYSYHVDRSPLATDTFLCTYFGAASDILPNNQAWQKILIPEIRQELQKLHDGPEAEFESFLEEFFFDLHYQAKAGAEPINLGTGHLWRLAVDHPLQEALPCIHRAPVENEGEYRLLLIC